jgi:hypothetical protein
MRRVRHPKGASFFHYKGANHSAGICSIGGMDRWVTETTLALAPELHAIIGANCEFGEFGKRNFAKSAAYWSWIYNECSINRSRQFFLSEFVKDETIAGGRIIPVEYKVERKCVDCKKDACVCVPNIVMFKLAKSEIANEVFTAIAGAEPLTVEEYDVIEQKIQHGVPVTDIEIFSRKRYKLLSMLKLDQEREIDEKFVKEFSARGVITLLNTITHLRDGYQPYGKTKTIHGAAGIREFESDRLTSAQEFMGITRGDTFETDTSIQWGKLAMRSKSAKLDVVFNLLEIVGFKDVFNFADMKKGDTIASVINSSVEIEKKSVNLDLLNAYVKDTGRKHICKLFSKKFRRGDDKIEFKTLKTVLQWINPMIKSMLGMTIKRVGSGKKQRDRIKLHGKINVAFIEENIIVDKDDDDDDSDDDDDDRDVFGF